MMRATLDLVRLRGRGGGNARGRFVGGVRGGLDGGRGPPPTET